MITLLIVEAEPTVARGLRLLFACQADLRIVGEASDVDAALHAVQDLRPDVVLMDIDCTHSGLWPSPDALRQVAGQASLILLTHFDNVQTDRLSEQVGAAAVAIKCSPPNDLLHTIRQTAGAA